MSIKSMIRASTGRNAASAGASASYQPYQAQKSQADRGYGGVANKLPPGNRIGPMNKVRGFNPGSTSGNQVNATVDARIGSGPKVDFDRKNKRTPISMAAPTSERKSSGRPGVAKYAGSKKGSK